MEKKIKYCAACEETFAEKFMFCPNCAAVLSIYEMNPILTATKKEESSIFRENTLKSEKKTSSEDGFYNITLVEERSGGTRRALLLGAALLVMGGAVFSLIGSIYNADAFVGSLDDSLVYLANVNNDDPYKLEEIELPKAKNENSSGSGTGGDKNPNPVSKGVLASQSEKPLIAPSVTMDKVTNPELKIRMETKGVVQRKPSDQRYGDRNSQYDVASDGPGENGGQGVGPDRGQGPDRGDGGGPGNPGPGAGPGPGGPVGRISVKKTPEKEEEIPEIKKPVGVTTALKILDKPRAIYTDAARRNQIAGTVTLRVTFMANGSIGNIVAVSGLSDGLTEQAIAAARNIRFEPAKRNGVAQTVTKQVQYTFTLY